MLTLAAPASATSGAQLWVNRYNGPGDGVDGARAEAVSPDGSVVFVTGHSAGKTSGLDYLTQAISASTGVTVWTRRYNGPGNGDDQACCIAVSPDGSTVYVTGSSEGTGGSQDYVTVAYDAASGAVDWSRRYNGPGGGDDQAAGLAVSPDGSRVFVTGSSDGGATGLDYATESLDAATGAVQWVRRYNGPGSGPDTAAGIAASPDGSSVYVAGASDGAASAGQDYATEALVAQTGAVRWVKRYNGPASGSDRAVAVKVSPDSASVFITGSEATATQGDDVKTLAYNASTGAKIWTKTLNDRENGNDEASGMVVSADGKNLYVTGTAPGIDPGSFAFETIGYDTATGTAFARRAAPGGADFVDRAIAISPDGKKLLLAGSFFENGMGGGINYIAVELTWGLQQSGVPSFVYDGPASGNDEAYAVAVSPDGTKVFVTGESEGKTSGLDYATVAYTP
jgi:WD40 repeat protein